MTARTVGLPTPARAHTETGEWFARWLPDDGGGGDLALFLRTGELEVRVLTRYLQNDPPDDATLRRWASEALAALADTWRPR